MRQERNNEREQEHLDRVVCGVLFAWQYFLEVPKPPPAESPLACERKLHLI
jgi:hypothetical protein